MSKKLTSKSAKKAPAKTVPNPVTASQDLTKLENIFKLMGQYGIGEIEIENDMGRIHARTQQAAAYSVTAAAPVQQMPVMESSHPHVAPSHQAPASAPAPKADGHPETAANQKKILSPFVGTFYRSASPTAQPYVTEGKAVKKGQTLCIIEAMKLMNEIESEFNGTVVKVLVENGQPVEFGEPLFIVET